MMDEQGAFELWLADKCPSGDVESVQQQWLDSVERHDFAANAYDSLVHQRDELLAALETIGTHTITDEDGDEVEVLFGDIGKISAAIAKAKGGAA